MNCPTDKDFDGITYGSFQVTLLLLESRRGDGCLPVVSVVFCPVEVPATS